MRLLLVVAAAAVAVGLLNPPGASASCAVPRPALQLRQADAAFVGRLVQELPDRWVFAVDEAVKGGLGAQVEVLRGGITSVSLTPEPGRQVGLLLVGDAASGWTSNACLQVSPAQLRAAAAHPGLACAQPRIRSVRFRTPGRVDVALGGLDDPTTAVTVRWGDGARSTTTLRRGAPRRTVVLRHRYRTRGRHRIDVAVAARPVPACGSFAERAAHPALVVRT